MYLLLSPGGSKAYLATVTASLIQASSHIYVLSSFESILKVKVIISHSTCTKSSKYSTSSTKRVALPSVI